MASVVRHIDTLEEELGAKLFQRHARGYTLTDAGHDLARVAGATQERFEDLAGRTRGRASEVSGEVIVTSVDLLAPLVLPALQQLRVEHPDTDVRYEASGRVFKLEYGEAHVAIRAGSRPTEPDNLVEPFLQLRSAVYAHRSYLERYGTPDLTGDCSGHGFIGTTTGIVTGWLQALVPDVRVVFASNDQRLRAMPLACGLGIGFYPVRLAERLPDLVQVHPPEDRWDVPFWLVTHVDLHRTAKVQAVLGALRDAR